MEAKPILPGLRTTLPVGAMSAVLALALLYGRAFSVGVAPVPERNGFAWFSSILLVLLLPGIAGAMNTDPVRGRVTAAALGLSAPLVMGSFLEAPAQMALALQLSSLLLWRTGRVGVASVVAGLAVGFDPRAWLSILVLGVGELDAQRFESRAWFSSLREVMKAIVPGVMIAVLMTMVQQGAEFWSAGAPFAGWTGIAMGVKRELALATHSLGPGAWREQFWASPLVWRLWVGAASLAATAGLISILRTARAARTDAALRLLLVSVAWILLVEGASGRVSLASPLPLATVALVTLGAQGCVSLLSWHPWRRLMAVGLAFALAMGLCLGLWHRILAQVVA